MARSSLPFRFRCVPLLLGVVLATSCREGSGPGGGGGSGTTLIPPALFGTNGCNGPDQDFAPPPAPTPIPLATLAIGPMSRIAAAIDEEKLYATGAGATVVELDFTGPALVETELVAGAFLQGFLLDPKGIPGPPELSGIAVLDPNNVVVMEHASNTVILVNRNFPDTVFFLLGEPSELPGFADGYAAFARFNFLEPGGLCPAGDGRIFVADTGNHRIRVAEPDPVGGFLVSTAAGTGIDVTLDGDLFLASFDTPEGLSVSCQNQVLITERGTSGGGNRLRALTIEVAPIFGFTDVQVDTLAGDGTPATAEGSGTLASLARPSPMVTTAEGDVYWVDTLTGVLRRYEFATGSADCPLNVDCPSAVVAPSFSAGGDDFSLAISAGGDLYVLDTGAATLYRIP